MVEYLLNSIAVMGDMEYDSENDFFFFFLRRVE